MVAVRTFDYLKHLVARSAADAERLVKVRCSNCNAVVHVSELAIANVIEDFYLCKSCKEPVMKLVAGTENAINIQLKSLGFIAYYLFEIAEPLTDEERLQILQRAVTHVKEAFNRNDRINAKAAISLWIVSVLNHMGFIQQGKMPQYAYLLSKMLKAYEHGVSALRREPVRTASPRQIPAQPRQSRPAKTQ